MFENIFEKFESRLVRTERKEILLFYLVLLLLLFFCWITLAIYTFGRANLHGAKSMQFESTNTFVDHPTRKVVDSNYQFVVLNPFFQFENNKLICCFYQRKLQQNNYQISWFKPKSLLFVPKHRFAFTKVGVVFVNLHKLKH